MNRNLTLGMSIILLLIHSLVYAGQNVVVVLDDSGSMGEFMRATRGVTRMEAAKRALNTVLTELPADANVGVVLLNGAARDDSWVIRLGPIDHQKTTAAIQSIRAQGGTPLGRFMKTGADALLERRDKEHYGVYRLLIVTDGEATDSHLVESYLPDILARGITVDVIGVDMARDHSLATQVHTYRSADDPDSLTRAISEVFAETDGTDQVADRDTDGSEFELFAELPDEVAVAALAALSKSDNDPVRSIEASYQPATQPGDGGSSATGPGAVPGGQRTGRGWLVAVVVVIFVVISMLTKKRARKRRRS